MRFPRFSRRMVNPRWVLYNAALLATVLVPAIGCGGKPATPPPGAEEETAIPVVDEGDDSASPEKKPGDASATDTVPFSPTDGKTPPDDSGAK